MKRLGSVILVFLMLATWQASTPRGAYACSCAQPPEPRDALEGASTVFSGKVVSVATEELSAGGSSRAVTFDVISSWKNVNQKQIVVRTAMDSAACGFDFEVGKRYLVYTYDNEGNPYTGLCDRTKLLTVSGEDIAKLGPGKPPVANAAPQANPQATAQPNVQPTPQPSAVKGEQATFIPYVIPIAAVVVIFLVVYMVMFRGKKA